MFHLQGPACIQGALWRNNKDEYELKHSDHNISTVQTHYTDLRGAQKARHY